MARAKPAWRRVLTGRYLRWLAVRRLALAFPALGRRLGFFPLHLRFPEGADRVLADEVRPVPASELEPDLEFLRLCLPHDTTAPGLSLPAGVVTGRRTAIYRRAWLDVGTGAILLPDRRRSVLYRGDVVNWNAISVRLRRPRVRLPGRAFAPVRTTNYFHLLVENGIRLIDLIESGVVADAPLTVVKDRDGSRVEAALWHGLAAVEPGVIIRHVADGALVEPDEAVVHFPPENHWEWPPVTRRQAERLAAAFDAVYGPAARAPGSERLYLTRGGVKLRNPLNADALEAALVERGFEPFAATDSNHPDQVARFRAARTVVAVHGAGLTNILFCAPGARIVEIFPANFVKSSYWRLAQRLDLEHRYVIGAPGDYDQRFVVDVDEVVASLDRR